MRKVFLVLVFVFSWGLNAQTTRGLKGPEAKNYKPWKHVKEATVVYVKEGKKNLKGPGFKNYKPWKDNSSVKSYVLKTNNKKRNLKGPQAKNYKQWRD